jgi:hypothetical protein
VSIWQSIFVAGWIVAVIAGRADHRMAGLIAVNFAVTFLFPAQIGIVGAADLVCAAVMISMGPRGKVIAGIFALMAAINALGHLGAWPLGATYAILDPMGWFMLAVLGGADHGIRKIRRAFGGAVGRWNRGVFPVSQRFNAGRDLGIHNKNNGWLNGTE